MTEICKVLVALGAIYIGSCLVSSCYEFRHTPKQAIVLKDSKGNGTLEIITNDGTKFNLNQSGEGEFYDEYHLRIKQMK